MDEQRFRAAERRLWSSVGVEPTERFVRLSSTGTDVRVQEWGTGAPVVAVHGGSNAGASWAALIGAVPDMRWIVVDRPGCGLSEPLPGTFDFDGFARFGEAFVPALLDAVEVDRAHLVATSYGGNVGIRSAAAAPDRIATLLLFGYSIGAPMTGVASSMRFGAIPGLGSLMARMPVPKAFVKSIFGQLGVDRSALSDEVVGWFHSLLNDTQTMANELRAGPGVLRPIAGQDPRVLFTDDELARVTMPVELLWGRDDPFGGTDVAASFAARFPDGSLTLVPGGHALWVDHTAVAVEATRRCWSRADLGG